MCDLHFSILGSSDTNYCIMFFFIFNHFRIGGDKIDIRFFMKPISPSGLIFWSGPDEMLPSSDYIALGFVNGALQFRYNLGSGEAIISYNNTRLFDGKWHYIHAQR